MKKIFSVILIICLMLSGTVVTYGSNDSFKVVGYYSGDLFNESVEKLHTAKLTHVMYAFLIPKEDGSLEPLEKPNQLAAVTKKAHNDGCKVYIALGGWSYKGKPLVSVFEKIASDDAIRKIFIENVVKFAKKNNLDGVEIDWEHPKASTIQSYEKLVTELNEALKKENLFLTAAVNGAWSTTAGPEVSKLLTDKCLDSFEFVNVMGYDMNNAEHSPLWFANASINYWLNRGIPATKIVLGMPLYARPSWMQYRDLVKINEENAYRDYIGKVPTGSMPEGMSPVNLESYYNGLNTLREKTRLAMEKAGGVMIFDVNEDVDFRDEKLGKYSVLTMIDETVKNMEGLTEKEIKEKVTVIVKNKPVIFSENDGFGQPFVDENNRTLVPMRKILESIPVTAIGWDNKTKTVTVLSPEGGAREWNEKFLTEKNSNDGNVNIGADSQVKMIDASVKIGESFITVNGEKVLMDTKAVIIEGRTYLPARAVLEAFGLKVTYSALTKTVYAT